MTKTITGYTHLGVTKTEEEWKTFLGMKTLTEDQFLPVYKEEFKKGDIVYWSGQSSTFGEVIGKAGECYHLSVYENTTSHDSCYKDYLRKATPTEAIAYKESLKVKINGYTAEKKGAFFVAFGCVELSKSELEAYKFLVSDKRINATISVGEQLITETTLDKLLNMLK
jgi:hypothetical protein